MYGSEKPITRKGSRFLHEKGYPAIISIHMPFMAEASLHAVKYRALAFGR